MKSKEELDRLRAGLGELENHYVDELVAGRLTRRDFVRRGSVIGLSAPVVGMILSACGSANSSGGSSSASSGASSPAGTPKQGGTLNIASQTPDNTPNPLLANGPEAGLLPQTGEFLTFDSNLKLQLQPMLATSWSPNHDASVWTFKLRTGVKFHNGAPFSADDVVYTFTQITDPKNASNALSTLGGVLTPAGVKKIDAHTVAFHLVSPNGNFPYLVSSDNWNSLIVPAGTDYAKWHLTFMGTGPFKLGSYNDTLGATFVANTDYWGPKPYLDKTNFKFYATQQPQILALEGGEVDVLGLFAPSGASSLLNNPSFKLIKLKSSIHRELSMRNDLAPFTDARVRQALALSLDRPGLVNALLAGNGSVGNDSPFAPAFASTNTTVPQRVQNLAKAKQLLSAAGHSKGFTVPLYTDQYQENPQLAQVIKSQAAQIGININLHVENQVAYYGKASFGNSDWLDGTLSLVEYEHRGVPNVFLEAALSSTGPFNAARFKNPAYDALAKQYVGTVDLQAQRQVAGKIETLLLAETPLIIPYWIDGLCAAAPSVGGLNPTSTNLLFLGRAYKS